jgi:hypothetical protein
MIFRPRLARTGPLGFASKLTVCKRQGVFGLAPTVGFNFPVTTVRNGCNSSRKPDFSQFAGAHWRLLREECGTSLSAHVRRLQTSASERVQPEVQSPPL